MIKDSTSNMKNKESVKASASYDLCLIFGLSGFLLGGIALTSVVTLLLKQEFCISESAIITTETTTTTTSTTTTSTTTSTSATSERILRLVELKDCFESQVSS
ncbi:unnamed protein product [Rotaria magnacalcarata]|uniref:Uncharacterized protein n=1 Tax=Rotaria magnacalcarata TaxID=392030 RepID=A0A820HD00_9BILA|nr:unnamed protein product [Rotaria magnacalcarata]CAF4006620.1 unnamed protein product [Rotaria magnacalcarata]CAF4282742.1 unnamed protein product [Rotaria magnacalcarata]CAF4292832.1 unnamed protein product [Rotaria magnacalcarata]CAF4293052.1 unnamed protein product [Rotaria magnacalcarata]